MAWIDETATLADLLLLLEPLMEESGWPRAANPRQREDVRSALMGHLGAMPHDDVVAWCWFSERWATARELWPKVVLHPWESRFDYIGEEVGFLAVLIDEVGLRGVFDEANPEESSLDCLTFGNYSDGLMTTMSPVTGGRGEPFVFEMSAEGSGHFTTVVGRDQPRWVMKADELPTLRGWVLALVDAHLNGRLHFTENPHFADGPTVVRGHGWTPGERAGYHFPWPDGGLASSPVPPRTQGARPIEVRGRRAVRADEKKSDLVWTSSGGRVIYIDGPNVKTIDVRSGQQLSDDSLGQFVGHRIRWNPDGTHYVVSGRSDSQLLQIVFQTDGRIIVHTLDGYEADWSPQGNFIKSHHRSSNEVSAEVVSTDTWAKRFGYSLKYAHSWWSPTDRHLVARGSTDVLLWSTDSNEPVLALPQAMATTRFDFAPDGSRLVETAGAGLRIVDPARGSLVSARSVTQIADIAWSPDSTELALATRTGQVEIVAPTGDLLQVFGEPQPIRNTRNLGVRWSPDGLRLVINCHVSNDEWVIRHAKTGEVLSRLESVDSPVPTCVWSPDGARVLGGRFVFDAETGAITHHLDGLESEGSWSPDSTTVAARTRVDITMWDLN